jgi:sugar lactone lactonase YvrE
MPPCDPTWIGAMCDRQYVLTGIVETAVNGDIVYMLEGDAVLTLDRTTGQVDVLSSAADPSNLGAEVGTGPSLGSARHLVMSGDGMTLYVMDTDERAVMSIDVATGDRAVVSDNANSQDGGAEVGTGPGLTNVNAMTWDPMGTGRLLAAEIQTDRLLAIDLATGDRTVVSDNTMAGPSFSVTRALAVGSDGTIYAYEQNLDSMYAVNPDDGSRTVISDDADSSNGGAEVGTGISLSGLRSIVFDPGTGLLYGSNTDINGVLSIDPASGNRAVLSDPEPDAGAPVGEGPNLFYPFAMSLGDGELIVDDSHQEVLTTVDLTTGDRAELLSSRLGEGYRPGNGMESVAHKDGVLYLGLNSDDKVVAMPLDTLVREVIVDVAGVAGSGPDPADIDDIVVHPSEDVLFVLDRTTDAVFRVDTTSLVREVVSTDSAPAVGTGPGFDDPRGIELDVANNVAYVVDRGLGVVFAVDLTSGDRSVFSGTGVGSGPVFTGATDIAIDLAGERLFVVDNTAQAVFVVDLAEATAGDRTVLSDDSDASNGGAAVGTGPALGFPSGVAFDAARDQLLIADRTLDAIVAVDLATGNRSIVSSLTDAAGTGWGFSSPGGLIVVGTEAFVVEQSDNYVATVQLEGDEIGDRLVIASGATVDSYY